MSTLAERKNALASFYASPIRYHQDEAHGKQLRSL